MADSTAQVHPADKFIEVNGLRLHHLDFGGDGRPWLVCVHGLSGNAHNFDPIIASLTRRYHVISVDVRGRGDSAWGPPTDYLPKYYVEDLAAILERLGAARATLIGTSMGGIISMMYAGGWPERVERLVLNDIGPDIDPAGAARIGTYMGVAPERFNDLGDVAAYYRKTYPAMANMPEAELRESVKWSVKPLDGGGLGWKIDPTIRRPIRGATAQQRPDLWVSFARITCPILVIRGAESDILSQRTVAQMTTTHTGVTVVEVQGVAHAPSLTEPEAAAALAKFLSL
ncbi:MAG: alpha/beta fold hydrolase [Candidatus Binataceae bacterium]